MITIKSFKVNYFSRNTYLLYDDTKEAVLIDCGYLHREEQKEASDFIVQNGLTPGRYPYTHLHLDHMFGNEFVHNAYGLSLEARRADVGGFPSLEEQTKAFGLSMKAKSVPIRKYPVNGEIIKFGKSELAILNAPGHSPRGVAFYNKKSGFVIVGGSLSAGGIGRTDLWGSNQDTLLATIGDKLLSLPDETMVCPSHGPKTRIIDEKLNNPYL